MTQRRGERPRAISPGPRPAALPAGSAALDPLANSARSVPEATVERLATYFRTLGAIGERGVATVSSEELAHAAGVNSAMLRKDLSHLGSYGVRGVGYDVRMLTDEIARALGLTVRRTVVLIGIGNLGQALAGYAGFDNRGFRIAALLDADPTRIGTTIHGLIVQPIDALADVVREHGVSIGVIATPAAAAQAVCDRLVGCGISSVLNFAPALLSVPGHVDVRKVDLAAELQILSFHESRKHGAEAGRHGAEVGKHGAEAREHGAESPLAQQPVEVSS